MKVAVVVDPYSSGNMFAPAFRAAGFTPVAVTSAPKPSAVYAPSYRPGDFASVVTHDGDLAATRAAVAALDPVCVVAGTESGVALADRLAPLITPGRANDAASARVRRHKGAMREALVAAGVPAVRQICTDSADAVAGWLRAQHLEGADLVVKPPTSAGTDGVTLVPAGADWRPVFDGLLHRRNKLDLVNDQVLVQERLVGTEYVVDTFSHDGVHTVVNLCAYGKRGVVYESLEWLPYDLDRYGELIRYTRDALDALGVRFGAAHSEVMMTAAGPRLIETGVRLHGGGQPRFCRVATGDSQVDRTVRYCAGEEVPDAFELRQHLMVVFLISRATGVVRNVREVVDRIGALPSHHHTSVPLRDGDRVTATHDLFSTLALGFVVLAHPDPARIRADHAAVRALEAELTVEPEPAVASEPALASEPTLEEA
ncbi:ATP-grasp domain-containing protein [Streptomyces sp. CA2R106]|uniref:ATP-grasp domain-containing protein n=1 Tax=Streptomyces sp. CA2R106 TaxID=3120153 RepID=UPI00300A62B1